MNNTKNEISDVRFFFVLIGLFLIAYFPSFTGDYIGDDVGRIAMLGPGIGLLEMLAAGLGDRPVLVTSLWLDRYVFGLNAGLMRFETILFLGIMALVLRKIVDALSERLKLGILPIWRDGIIALYCLHPLHTQALTHVVQRGIILSSLGGLLATLLLVRVDFDWRKLSWRLALLVWMLALLAKPNIAFLPVFWIILAITLRVDKKNIISISVFFFMLLLPILNYKIGQFNVQEIGENTTALNYFSVQAKALLIYARLIVVPVGLSFNHDLGIPTTEFWKPGIILWSLYLLVPVIVLRFAKQRIVGVFAIGALLAFVPESSIFPIMHPVFEHRTFFPMAFMALSIILCIGSYTPRKWSLFVLSLLLVLSVVLCFRRNTQTQRFSNWAEHELKQTCYLDHMQLHFLERLLEYNHYEEARRGLDSLKRCEDGSKNLLLCFEALYTFSIQKNLSTTGLEDLKGCIHSERKLEKLSRMAVNSLVVKKSQFMTSEKPIQCHLEDFFSAQLRVFKKERKDFSDAIAFYALMAEGCLEKLATRKDPESNFQRIKIRTIKLYHFGVPDENLAGDLAKAPQTHDYDYLRTLLETAAKL